MAASNGDLEDLLDPGVDKSAVDEAIDDAFTCSACGRTDLPQAGGWNPPICLECDAALNFEQIELNQEDH